MAYTFQPAKVDTYENVDLTQFNTLIRPKAEPAILRGAIAHWPAVKDADAKALFKRLTALDNGKTQATLIGATGTGGAFHYAANLRGRNYTEITETLSAALTRLLENPTTDGTYIQSIPIPEHMPNFMGNHPFNLVPDGVPARAWIGNQTTVQTHFDASENIACVVLGTREVTLFPPEELPGLYPGPLETAPGGVVVSLTSLDTPDFEAHPRFKDALKNARRATLAPGDALYIPFGWWHHVRATSPLNMLVNYWWTDKPALLDDLYSPIVHAMLCYQQLNPQQAKIWQSMFTHFVFKQNGEPMAHIPSELRGLLGGVPEKYRDRTIYGLLKTLGQAIGLAPPPDPKK
ncbi:MAG: hypothetical protein COA69_03905 [Robiginitomaculum sp.]|nr:MAG: hypothetical protein COA69_03905 [Robiginitomaculum sp.]